MRLMLKRILIVDDIKGYLDSLANALRGEYDVLKVRILEEAKNLATNQRFDIALVLSRKG